MDDPATNKKERLIMLKHLDHLNLTVKNLDETVNWYDRVFGFKVVDGAVEENVSWKL